MSGDTFGLFDMVEGDAFRSSDIVPQPFGVSRRVLNGKPNGYMRRLVPCLARPRDICLLDIFYDRLV